MAYEEGQRESGYETGVFHAAECAGVRERETVRGPEGVRDVLEVVHTEARRGERVLERW